MALYLRVSEAGQETVISALTLFDGRNSIQLEKKTCCIYLHGVLHTT